MDKTRSESMDRSDRWSYVWLIIGTLIGFLWRVPLTWWLSPIFLLRFSRTQRPWRSFLLVWLSVFVTASLTMHGIMNAMMPGPLPVYLVTMAVTALMMGGIPYLADRLIAPRVPGFAGTLVFPLVVTSLDYVGARMNPIGSVGAYAYFQYGNPALMQLLAITGMWGITFLVNWLGSVVNWAWERGFEPGRIRLGSATYAGILLVVLLYGGARIAHAREPASTVRMHGFTALDMRQQLVDLHEAAASDWHAFRNMSADIQDLYLEGTRREARAGAELVHWPEMAVMIAKEDEAAFIARGQELARQEGVYVSMNLGTMYEDRRPTEIKLIVVDPAGHVVLEHLKYGGTQLDGAATGDGILRTVVTPFGTLSGVICNDTNHEEVVAQAGRNGTDILLSPSLELEPIDPIHAHMAIYRAIENGITVVRQADNGLSFVVDPYGRVTAAMDHWSATERVMVAQVPVGITTSTVYARIGDLVAWLSLAGFAAFAVWAAMLARRARSAGGRQPRARAIT